MGSPVGLVFLLLTVAGLLGLIFVTAPGLDYMFGSADEDSTATIAGVLGTAIILWLSTGFFLLLTIGGILLTILFS